MKTLKYFTLAACALLGLAACSSDDAVNEGASQIKDGNGYVSFNIVTNGGTRADNVFEDGTGNENTVEKVLFVFYNVDGSYATKRTKTLTFNGPGTTSPAVEKIADATVVLSEKAINSRQVLVVLNHTAEIETALTEVPLKVALEELENYGNMAGDKPFLMTNSSYIQTPDNQLVCATSFTEKNVQKTEADAIKNPVDIYVERVLAKVELDLTGVTINPTNLDGVTSAIGTGEVKVYPEIKNYQDLGPGYVVATSGESYLFKDISHYKTWSHTNSWTWNDPTNRRSYWADMPGSVTPGGYVPFPSYENPANPTAIDPNKKDFGSATYYVQENTSSDENNQSKVIVFAQLKDEDGYPVELIYCNGAYYDRIGYLNLVAQQLRDANVYYVDGNEDKTFTTFDLQFVQVGSKGNKAYNVKLELTDAAKERQLATGAFGNDGKKYGTAADMEKIFNEHVAQYWQDGKCYYYVTIEHQALPENKVLNGVVRNHVYKVKVNSISGLGTPVFVPDSKTHDPDPIIPEKPDEVTWNLAAKINVLKWRVVSQNVDLK